MVRHADVPLWVQVGDVASNEGDVLHAAPAPLLDQRQQRRLRRGGGGPRGHLAVADAASSAPTAVLTRSVRGAWQRSAARSRRAGITRRPRRSRLRGAGAWAAAPRSSERAATTSGGTSCERRSPSASRSSGIDLFLTHEAPRPFYPAGRRIDAGKTAINEVLTAMRPRLHLFGHHHEFTDSVRHGIRSIGLDVVTQSYLLIDAQTFRCER